MLWMLEAALKAKGGFFFKGEDWFAFMPQIFLQKLKLQ